MFRETMNTEATRNPRHGRYVVRSPSAARRLWHATRWLDERGRATELVVVGATSEAATELTRRVGREAGATFGWHHLTLTRLAWTLAAPSLSGQESSPVGAFALEAICARIVYASAAAGTLGRFAPIGDRPGLPRALARTFGELRLGAIEPGSLGDADLGRLLAEYGRQLAGARLVDRADLLATATALLEAGAAHPLVGKPVLLLDVPIATERELRFIRAIAARSGDLLVTIPAGDERTWRSCEALGGEIVADSEPVQTPLQRLQAGLFAETAVKAERAEGIVVFSAPGENRECVEIARSIHRQAEAGVPFDRIAVLLRSPTQYRLHLEEAFRRAGIPAHFARGTARPDPTGRAFLSLLACAAQGLSAARFAEYLSIGEVPDATATGSPPGAVPSADRWVPADDDFLRDAAARAILGAGTGPGEVTRAEASATELATIDERPVIDGTLRAPRQWERLIVDAAVIGGIDRWRRRLAGLQAEFELRLAELEDPEDASAVRLRRTRAALRELREYALPLLEELAGLPARAPWGVWLDHLGSLASRSLRTPARVLSVLAELAPMAEVGPVDLAEVRIVLERRLVDVVQPPSERRFGRVFVASTEEARGLVFDVVFVPGLAEKIFPQKIAEDPILPDGARHALDRGLPTNADRAALERLALHIAVGAAKERVVLSYPRIDLEQSRPRTPSFYSLEVIRASEGELPGFDELARRADTIGAARIGWPAPSRSVDAIDHAEHDLALLETIMKRPESETVGTARYLLTANAHLARALRFRARRWLGKWTEADGLVTPAAPARLALAAHALTARSYSPTGLQNYAACPYRFVLQAIHRLSPREEPTPLEELDPLHKGSLIHEVQFELHGALRDDDLIPITVQNIERVRVHLERVLDRVVTRYADELAPAIDRVWADGIAGVRADLLEWLRRASLDTSYRPMYFELSFGLGHERQERDRRSTDAPARLDSGINLRGSIDLVEKSRTGALRATDYKTGKARAPQGTVIGGGEVLQPVLYSLALEKVLPGERVEGGRLYYCTAAGDFTEVPVPLDDSSRQAAQLVADTVQQALTDGFLPAAPKEGACEYCDYLRVCGPSEEQRTKRKKGDALVPLLKLRSHP
jgi:CRISPR/Cas system-associated exonuclease Cas4 (RecB family)